MNAPALLVAVWSAALPATPRVADQAPIVVRADAAAEVVLTAPAALPDPVRWFALDPIAADYSNAKRCGRPPAAGCHDPIRYRVRPLAAAPGRSLRVADVPELSGPGTHRVRAAAAPPAGAGAGEEAGEEALEGAFTLVVRADDSYVGYLTELLGVPFVYWPAHLSGVGHQTDARLGADCVSTVIYGRRRMGCPVPYYVPAALFRLAAPVPPDAHGAPAVRAGDVLHFGFQTAVLAEDRPPLGRLDDGDLVIHAYHGLVERVPFGSLPYRVYRHEVLRWPECRPPARRPAVPAPPGAPLAG